MIWIVPLAAVLSIAGLVLAFKASEREELETEEDDVESDFTPRS